MELRWVMNQHGDWELEADDKRVAEVWHLKSLTGRADAPWLYWVKGHPAFSNVGGRSYPVGLPADTEEEAKALAVAYYRMNQ